jgi:Tfp pilus assembly protein PilE
VSVATRLRAGFRWWQRHPWITFWLTITSWIVFVAAAENAPLGKIVGGMTVLALVLAHVGLTVASLGRGLYVSWRKSKLRGAVITLVVVGAILAVMIPLYNNIGGRAKIAKAQADVRSLASAVSLYAAHMGSLPKSLEDVTKPSTNAKGESSGAFLAGVPTPPVGWTPGYSYVTSADGTFTISATGDYTTARVP